MNNIRNRIKKVKFRIVFLIVLVFLCSTGIAIKCRNTYKKCKSPDKTYTESSLSRSIRIKKGKKLRVVLNLYGGRTYYVSTYSKQKVGMLHFRIIDVLSNRVIYDNSTEGLVDNKVFAIDNTQKLYVEISAPLWKSNDLYECAGFRIAYKKMNLF